MWPGNRLPERRAGLGRPGLAAYERHHPMTSDSAAQEGPDGGLADEPPAFDISVAHQARIYDYWLGGKDNFAADRKAAEAAAAAYPGVVSGSRANRQFLARAVTALAREHGIRQFLDIGTGIPSSGHTHEVAQSVAPESHVVYVDYDPVVLAHARALLAGRPEGTTAYLDADLRDTQTILAQAAKTLDFSQPVAIFLLAILQAIPDSDDPYAIVESLLAAVPSGSWLVISHPASDIEPEKIAAATARLNELSHQQFTLRDHDGVLRFFSGLEMAEPGLIRMEDWRPDSDLTKRFESAVWAGMGRKP
jgi:S-adenosyl methyltransferase